MTWQVKFKNTARRELRKLDRQIQDRILRFLRERIAIAEDPRRIGKALTGPLGEFWRYQVGDYRILCTIADRELLVWVVAVRHRSEAYK
jgi:mRNA interferase RelE/StbE